MSRDDRLKQLHRFGLLGLLQINIAKANFHVRIVGIELQDGVKFRDSFILMRRVQLGETCKIVRALERRIAIEGTMEGRDGTRVIGHVEPQLTNEEEVVERK